MTPIHLVKGINDHLFERIYAAEINTIEYNH